MIPIIALAFAFLTGCGGELEPPEHTEEAYVGPYSLDLLAELRTDAEVTTTLRHGERVEIIGRRRRFAQVRTAAGGEGWTDGWMLLSPDQMARMRRLSMHAAQLPSQGIAKVYDKLNIHTSPHRQAPSFFQMTEGVQVQVVSHRVEPRRPYSPPTSDQEVFPRPHYRVSASAQPPAGGADDWTLVRVPDGRAGWALSRMLMLAVPDEVAQYAEGQRITSYFSLGEVTDGDVRKHHWLWTTISRGLQPYEFDSFRVFVWSLRRHRYETAYIERDLVGYYPVEVHSMDSQAGESSSMPRFSLVVGQPSGSIERRTYAFSGYRVPFDLERALGAATGGADASPESEAGRGGTIRTVRHYHAQTERNGSSSCVPGVSRSGPADR